MSMSQDEIDRLMSQSEGGGEPVKSEGALKVFEKMARLFSDAINNIFPILIDTEQVQMEPGVAQKGRLGEMTKTLAPDSTYFVFYCTSLTDFPFIGALDRPIALNISQRMMGQEGETELTEALLSGLAEAFNNVLGAWDTAMSEEFGLAVAHSDLKFLEGDILDTLVAEAGLEPTVSAVQSAFSIKIDEVRGGIALMATTECIEKIFVSHPSSKKEAKAPAGPADAGRETTLKTTSPVPQPAEKVQVAPAPEVPLARFEELTPHQTTEPPRGVDLILDVPLLVAVELGRKSLSVKDILELVPGSLVELDKLAGEAVDLLVNGKLFARGEVVVIDENFGVRISAIISPKDRIESLR